MKAEIIEYYPNGSKKYIVDHYSNQLKKFEQYYDQRGQYHRDGGLPDYQKWDKNGITEHKTYYIHGGRHNINNPSDINFITNGKIWNKSYWLNNCHYFKLNWQNVIKNI